MKIALFRKAGEVAGARRAISEIIKWLNYVTDNRVLTRGRGSFGVGQPRARQPLGPLRSRRPIRCGTRLKAAIQEAGNVSTAIGLVSQNASVDPDKFAGVWAFSGTYGAFTPLMYLPARVWSQQNQDSKFRTGVLHILVGALRSGNRGRRAHALRHLLAAGVEAVPARSGDQPELLGLQRRRARLLRRGRDRGAREEGRHHHASKSRVPTSRSPIAARSPTPICGRGQGPVRHPRLRARQAAPRLRRRAGIELDVQSRERAAEARSRPAST